MLKIMIFNQKGGTAKTTSTFNIAGYMAKKYNKKVLVIDTDPQASLSKTLLMENNFDSEIDKTIVDIFNKKCDINEIIQTALLKTRGNAIPKNLGIDVIPSSRLLSSVDLKSEYELVENINRIEKEYDIILFDCSPYLSLISINVMAASDFILVPATADKDSLDGYGQLIDTMNSLKLNGINYDIRILGVFITIMSVVESFDKYIFKRCRDNFGEQFIDLSIRRSTSAKQSNHFGTPLCWFKPNSNVALDYEKLTDIIFERVKRYSMLDRLKKDIKGVV